MLIPETRMKKPWVKIVIAVGAVFILVLALIPLFVNADTFRPSIQSQLSAALGRRITLGHLSLSLFSGSIVAEDIAISDDPAFSTSPFISAKKFSIGVEMGPLLFHRQVRITKLTIDAPSINLLHKENGLWNFSSIGGAKPTEPSQQPAAIPDLTVGELRIEDGTASVSAIPALRKPFVYSSIDLDVKQFSFLKSFPFELSAKLPASGTLDLKGDAGPLNQKNAADTPFHATLALKQLDPVAAGLVDPGQGISMVVDIDSELGSNGVTLNGSGKIKAAHLQVSRTGSPTPHPVDVAYSVSENLDQQTGQISNVSVQTGTVAAHATGTYRMTPRAILLDLHIAAPNLPIDQLEELLPAFGVQLPTGSQLRGGTLTANLTVSGPATATTIAGPIEVDNTKLAGFDIGSKIQGLNLFKGGGGTDIQTLRATVNSSPQITQINNIYGNLPQIGSATGGGTVSPAGALDFKMVATLTSNNAVGAVANQAINTAKSYIGSFLHPNAKPTTSNSNQGIPLTITGTTKNPSIRANIIGMLR